MRRTVPLALAVTTALAAGCSSGSKKSAGLASETPLGHPAPSAGRPPPRPPALVSGLNGARSGLGRPVLAVKIDNTAPAHPQIGLGSADVVYVEQVEGGLTRLLAIFSSTVPTTIGPTRSARESDLELLREYGKVILAFSGANSGVLRAVRRAPVVNGSSGAVGRAYFRAGGRPAPYNLILRPRRLLGARHSAAARDVGFRFGPRRPASGRPSRGFSVRYGPFAKVAIQYAPRRHSWSVAMDGRRSKLSGGRPVAPANVIVQYVKVRQSRFHDVLGNPTPYTRTIGTGRAIIYREGRAYPARWSRPRAAAGTRFLDRTRHDVPLRPGQTWVLLVPRGTSLRAP